MKRAVALILSIIIMVFSLCSCGGNLPGKNNTELTAKNFTTLADADGYLYGFGGEQFGLCVFWFNGPSNTVKMAYLNNDLSINHSRLSNSSDWIITPYDDQHFTLEADWATPFNFKLLYSDPKGEYVVFADENKMSNGRNFLQYQLTFTNKQTLSSILEKAKQTTSEPQNLEQWISFVDSCK